jgi:hypothetical protein
MARLTGLEPATPGVTGRYSNQLSYNRARFRVTPSHNQRQLQNVPLTAKNKASYNLRSIYITKFHIINHFVIYFIDAKLIFASNDFAKNQIFRSSSIDISIIQKNMHLASNSTTIYRHYLISFPAD